MRNSIIGGLTGGVISSLVAIYVNDAIGKVAGLITFFVGVLVGGLISGLDKKLWHRILGLLVFYITSTLALFLHTAILNSSALFGVIALIFYSPFIIALYMIGGYVLGKLVTKRG